MPARTLAIVYLLLLAASQNAFSLQGSYQDCLQQWQPESSPSRALSGQWCLQYGALHDTITVPGLWRGTKIGEETIPGIGVATYRLRVHHGIVEQALSIRLPRPYDRYRVLINNKAILPDGAVPYFDQRRPHYWQFSPEGEHTDILIEVSNSRFVSGGLREPPVIGLATALDEDRLQKLALQALQSGLLTLMAFILFAQYAAMRRRYSAGVFFGLTCLGVAIFAGLGGEQWLSLVLAPLGIFPDLNWRWAMIAISVLGLSEFIHLLYPRESSRRLVQAWRVIAAVFLLLCIALPARWLAWSFWVFEGLTLLMSAYLVLVVFLAAWRKRSNALSTAVLFALLFLAVAHDILTDLSGIYAGNLGPTAMVLCLVGQGLVLSRQNARAHIQSLQLVRRQERAEKVKDEFLANTSHELRTPLQTIIGLASTNSPQNTQLIGDTAKRLALLVDDLMDLTRMRHQDIPIETTPLRVEHELQTMQQLFAPLISHRELTIEIALESNNLCVNADPRRLRQVLYNLLGNAVKFTSRGHITLYAEHSEQGIRIGVRDTGPGMSLEQQTLALQRYQQAEQHSEGIGLGLPISQGILEAHGSRLELQSSSTGTDISFQLEAGNIELCPARAAQPATSVVERGPEQSAPAQDYILVIDDDGAVLQALGQMLAPLGNPVILESRIDQALLRIGERKPALVILDLMMPQISGFEVLQTLRLQYSSEQLPIIVLTARHGQHDLRRALTLGANDYAVKPCEPLELLERVRSQLRLNGANEAHPVLNKLSPELLAGQRPIALLNKEGQLLDANDSGRNAFETDAATAELKLPLGEGTVLLWPADTLPEEPRQLLVSSLQEALAIWQDKGGNRVSLAEKSRQWRVQLDGSTARSRTFDRYFSLSTLPKRPNIDRVIRTLHFVVEQLPEPHANLEKHLQKLRALREENRQAFYE